jgi:hypothetical protein
MRPRVLGWDDNEARQSALGWEDDEAQQNKSGNKRNDQKYIQD